MVSRRIVKRRMFFGRDYRNANGAAARRAESMDNTPDIIKPRLASHLPLETHMCVCVKIGEPFLDSPTS